MYVSLLSVFFFFFNDTATTEIYTLSLHDALPISELRERPVGHIYRVIMDGKGKMPEYGKRVPPDDSWAIAAYVKALQLDRKSTRLNSSHANISYAVFCLKKKKKLITKSPVLQLIH